MKCCVFVGFSVDCSGLFVVFNGLAVGWVELLVFVTVWLAPAPDKTKHVSRRKKNRLLGRPCFLNRLALWIDWLDFALFFLVLELIAPICLLF